MEYLIKIKTFADKRSLFEWCSFFVVLNLILRLLFITRPDVQLDEPFSIYYAAVSWDDLWEMMKTENNPPLHFIFLKGWTSIAGFSVFALRLPSVIFASLTVIFVILIGEKYFKRYTGIIAAVFYTFSIMVMYHSHEVRVYALFIMITSSSFYVFLKYLETEKLKYVLLLGVLNSLLIYSHFVGWFVIGIQGLTVLISYRNDFIGMIKRGFLLCIPVVFYLPYIAIFFSRVQGLSKGTWIDPPTLHDLYRMLYKFVNKPLLAILTMVLFVFYVGYGFYRKNKSDVLHSHRVAIFLWWMIPLIGLWVYSFYMPFYLSRYAAFGVPGLCLYLAFMLSTLDKWFPKLGPYIIAIFLILFIGSTDLVADGGSSIKSEWQKMAELKDQNTSVIISPEWYNKDFAYYYEDGKYFREGLNMEAALTSAGVYSFHMETNEDSLAHCCLKNQVVVFHFMDDDFLFNKRLLEYMKKNYREEIKISDRVSLYKK